MIIVNTSTSSIIIIINNNNNTSTTTILIIINIPVSTIILLCFLVGGFNPSEKIWKSVGIMTFPIYGKKNMFQTTNQVY